MVWSCAAVPHGRPPGAAPAGQRGAGRRRGGAQGAAAGRAPGRRLRCAVLREPRFRMREGLGVRVRIRMDPSRRVHNEHNLLHNHCPEFARALSQRRQQKSGIWTRLCHERLRTHADVVVIVLARCSGGLPCQHVASLVFASVQVVCRRCGKPASRPTCSLRKTSGQRRSWTSGWRT